MHEELRVVSKKQDAKFKLSRDMTRALKLACAFTLLSICVVLVLTLIEANGRGASHGTFSFNQFIFNVIMLSSAGALFGGTIGYFFNS